MNPVEFDNQLPTEPGSGSPVTRPELAFVAILLLLGFALRVWQPDRMAVEHFDEGVYASNLFCGPLINPDAPYSYPDRHLYAPPLLPALLEFVLSYSGGSPGSVMWVNVLVGALTVPVVWWIARDWFGPVSGIIAGTLAAASEYHIAFSRTALTDPLLCLWMLMSVYAGWNAILIRRPFRITLVWIVLAGATAGLAWCTKYNGWLALAVTGSGSLAWLVVSRRDRYAALHALLAWAGTATIAALSFWWFVLRDLDAFGGYSAVAANHAQYFGGAGRWWTSLVHQLAGHRIFDGWVSLVGLFAAVLAGVSVRRFTWNRDRQDYPGIVRLLGNPGVIGLAVLAVLVGLLTGTSLLLGLSGLLGILWTLCRPDPGGLTNSDRGPARSDDAAQPTRLAAWMTAAWFTGLLVAVPLYHPYPRLSLPLLIPCWFGAAALFSRLVRSPGTGIGSDSGTGWSIAVVGLGLLAGIAAMWRGEPFVPARFSAWRDRSALHQIAADVLVASERYAARLPDSKHPDFDAVFYVYGEPAIFFHLEALTNETSLRFVTQPAGNLDMTRPGATDPRVATFLITGMHEPRDPGAFAQATQSLPRVAAFAYEPSALVLLDDMQTGAGESDSPLVQVYLLHPPSS